MFLFQKLCFANFVFVVYRQKVSEIKFRKLYLRNFVFVVYRRSKTLFRKLCFCSVSSKSFANKVSQTLFSKLFLVCIPYFRDYSKMDCAANEVQSDPVL